MGTGIHVRLLLYLISALVSETEAVRAVCAEVHMLYALFACQSWHIKARTK